MDSAEQEIHTELEQLKQRNLLSPKYQEILGKFFQEIKNALLQAHQPLTSFLKEFRLFIDFVEKNSSPPFGFQPYHRKIRTPIDYYRFGLEFVRPLVDLSHSKIFGHEVLAQIERQVLHGENAIMLANHQAEIDPQLISLLLESNHPVLAESIIYVAGERVVTDPLAIPFSMGCDLLCIYSKRYIDHPPDLKAKKQLHNKHTMERMSRLLSEGGKAIYVAPSGGRDRRNASGKIEVAPFDPPSLEMLYLMAKKSKKPTHFYPLVLTTYEILPPPDSIQKELGEKRVAKYGPIQLSFLPEFDMEHFPGSKEPDKTARREARANAIWELVRDEHDRLVTNRFRIS